MGKKLHPTFPEKMLERMGNYQEDRGIDRYELIRTAVNDKLAEEGY